MAYFPVGHDIPHPLFDESLLNTKRDKISLLFAGIGDARHLFVTLLIIECTDKMIGICPSKCFHFTVLDHKPATMAKVFLLLQILEQLTRTSEDGAGSRMLYYLLYYL